MEMKVDFVLNTCGDSLWSNKIKPVTITDIRLVDTNEDDTFGELCVYFDGQDWDVNENGLIYTDSLFLDQLKHELSVRGISTEISYSEQGMQGDYYVSFDVGREFIDSFLLMYGTE
jgi:arginine/lysine/ornithine decarboxylase